MGNNNSSTESVNQDGSNVNDGDDQATMNGNVQKKPEPKKKIYCCHVCGKKFATNSQANRHIDVHEGRRFICDYQNCDSIFTSRWGLQQHVLIHTGEKPYACKVCDQKFRRHHHLQLHLRIHTGEKPYVCGVCDNVSSNFSKHMKTHTGVKEQFTCAHCGKSYTQKGDLKLHLIKCFKKHDFQDRFDDH